MVTIKNLENWYSLALDWRIQLEQSMEHLRPGNWINKGPQAISLFKGKRCQISFGLLAFRKTACSCLALSLLALCKWYLPSHKETSQFCNFVSDVFKRTVIFSLKISWRVILSGKCKWVWIWLPIDTISQHFILFKVAKSLMRTNIVISLLSISNLNNKFCSWLDPLLSQI